MGIHYYKRSKKKKSNILDISSALNSEAVMIVEQLGGSFPGSGYFF